MIISTGASALAVFLGSTAAYGLSRFNYKFGPMRNPDISETISKLSWKPQTELREGLMKTIEYFKTIL